MPIWLFALGVIHTPIYSFPLSSLALVFSALILGLCVLWLKFFSSGYLSKYSNVLFWPMCFILGTAIGSFQLNKVCDNQLPSRFEGEVYLIRMKVVSIPKTDYKSSSFIAHVQELKCSASVVASNETCPQLKNHNIRLSWYYPPRSIQAGQLWELSVKVKRPRGFVNPSGFDYQAWLLSQEIVATGYVRQNKKSQPVYLGLEDVWASVRERINSSVLQKSDRQFDRFWSALLIGDRSSMTAEDWSTLQATGTVHLMAISGLHIGLVAFLSFSFGALVIRVWALVGKGSGVLVHRLLPPLFSLVGASYYAALAGFSIPTLRAMTACLIVNACIVIGVKLPALTTLGICVAVLGIVEPLVWVNAGFWLSFVAVGILVFSLGGRKSGKSSWQWCKVQFALSLGLMAPLLFIGQGFSVVGPMANLVAVPIISLLVVPTLLLVSIMQYVSAPFSQWILQYLDYSFGYLWWYLSELQSIPSARWWPSQVVNGKVLMLGFIGSLYLLCPVGLRVKALGVLWLIYAGWGKLSSSDELRITVMDVGQGLAVVVNTPEVSWVYDTGPKYSAQFDAGSQLIAPYLRYLGFAQSSLIVSHNDGDHSGGAKGLMKSIVIDDLYVGEPITETLKKGVQCYQGQTWSSGPLYFEALWPPAHSGLTSNRASCVVHMRYLNGENTVSVLFTGDIDRSVERQLIPLLPRHVNILIAPHHGSKSSSSKAFIERIQPKHIVFSAGYKNRYKHPSTAVVERYQALGGITHNTGVDGAVSFVWGKENAMIVEKERIKEPKLWYLD